jgi:hypothetical protein
MDRVRGSDVKEREVTLNFPILAFLLSCVICVVSLHPVPMISSKMTCIYQANTPSIVGALGYEFAFCGSAPEAHQERVLTPESSILMGFLMSCLCIFSETQIQRRMGTVRLTCRTLWTI